LLGFNTVCSIISVYKKIFSSNKFTIHQWKSIFLENLSRVDRQTDFDNQNRLKKVLPNPGNTYFTDFVSDIAQAHYIECYVVLHFILKVFLRQKLQVDLFSFFLFLHALLPT
jgi:hypothetical protein